ncbi:hypothetical protein T484DRAFT_1847799 [Baffinella frigidus]|nr:hypothetical protein T484DRAFT_1847799 [Cryptophyta sp. CCMP2293]
MPHSPPHGEGAPDRSEALPEDDSVPELKGGEGVEPLNLKGTWHLSECSADFSQAASTDVSPIRRRSHSECSGRHRTTVTLLGYSSLPSTRSTTCASLASDLHRLLYAAHPVAPTNPQESPPSLSKAVREWQNGRCARQLVQIRTLTEPSVVSSYFREELRSLLATQRCFASWSTRSQGGSAEGSQGGSASGSPLASDQR